MNLSEEWLVIIVEGGIPGKPSITLNIAVAFEFTVEPSLRALVALQYPPNGYDTQELLMFLVRNFPILYIMTDHEIGQLMTALKRADGDLRAIKRQAIEWFSKA